MIEIFDYNSVFFNFELTVKNSVISTIQRINEYINKLEYFIKFNKIF